MDIKLVIAISSVVHIGIILIGILLLIKLSIFGRYYIIISHGFISSGLFYLVNLIYVQTNRRLIFINKGIIIFIPSLIILWFILSSLIETWEFNFVVSCNIDRFDAISILCNFHSPRECEYRRTEDVRCLETNVRGRQLCWKIDSTGGRL